MPYKMFPSHDAGKPEENEVSSPGGTGDDTVFDDNIIDVQEEADEIGLADGVTDTNSEPIPDVDRTSADYSVTSNDDAEGRDLQVNAVAFEEDVSPDDRGQEKDPVTSANDPVQKERPDDNVSDQDHEDRPDVNVNDRAQGGKYGSSFSSSRNTASSTAPSSSRSSDLNNPSRPVKKSRKWQYAGIFLILLLIIGGSFVVIFQSFGGEVYPTHDRVAVIYVQGTMITGNVPSGFGYATSEAVCDNLRRAAADDSVKAIVMRINSGGGSPVASEEIIVEMKKVQDQGIPIVISMGDVAASAAYHISAPADLIMANPSTVTGSIGVISVYTNRSAYYEEEGIEFDVIKSGQFKDMGRDWRGLSDEEREYADRVVLEVYDLFIEDIARDRNMTLGEVKDIADGRIYTGVTARKIGLVDEFGNLYDAIDAAAELGGVEGDPSVHYMNKPFISSLLFGSEYAPSDEVIRQLTSYYEDSPVGKIMA